MDLNDRTMEWLKNHDGRIYIDKFNGELVIYIYYNDRYAGRCVWKIEKKFFIREPDEKFYWSSVAVEDFPDWVDAQLGEKFVGVLENTLYGYCEGVHSRSWIARLY